MKKIIQLEELAMMLGSLYVISIYNPGISVWVWILLFFAPDIGMIGYAVNTKVGAFTYNLFHHKGIALLLLLWGFVIGNNILIVIGALLFAHSSFDRILGYGLKYDDDFKHTHLGRIGK